MKTKAQFTKALASNLRRLRNEKGMSQEELAHKAGFYRTYIGHIENAKYSPSAYTLYKLAHVLGVNLSELLRNK